jgi:GDP-mannose 6-dehydrogenase
MQISVFGLGYVGTVCAACLADRGQTVVGVDKNQVKVDLIQSGRSPIIEREIHALVQKTVKAGNLRATTDAAEAVAATEISIVCVGTPSQANGNLSLHALGAVAREIGEAIGKKANRHIVALRSTVTPGTTRGFFAPQLLEAAPREHIGISFNPEFLREGSAVADFNTPSRTVVGALDSDTAATVMSLYDDLPGAKVTTAIETAELIKYVDNAWHAVKVTFANEIGVIAKTLGIDSHEVMDIFFQDTRLNISTAYLRPAFAFGGSCLPKDLRALTYLARRLDLRLPVLNHIIDSNKMLIDRGVEWILDQSNKRVAFLGMSFKRGTDDVRESPYVDLVERLIGKGCEVRIFDPNVQLSQLLGANRDYLLRVLPHVTDLMVPTIEEVISWAQTIVVTAHDPVYVAALAAARPEQAVLDFARIKTANRELNVKGFLW